jgi:hypothetical protein
MYAHITVKKYLHIQAPFRHVLVAELSSLLMVVVVVVVAGTET